MQTMVIVYNPPDIGSWTDQQRVARWERVAEWHEYAVQLNRAGKLTHAWGSHGLTDAAIPNPRQHIIVTIYSTDSFAEFNELREADPLLDHSEYLTVPLISLEHLREVDELKLADFTERVLRDDPINQRVYAEHRAVSKTTPPKFVGQFPVATPSNPGTDFDQRAGADAPLTVLLYGVNPDEYVNQWDDMTKLLHCQKMVWWHDYMAKLYAEGHVTHVWGAADYTSAITTSTKTGGNVSIHQARDFEEFDGLYRIDPVRSKNLYLSAALRPIADQRDSDRRRLELAGARARSTFV